MTDAERAGVLIIVVRDIMTRPVVTTTPGASRADVRRLMSQHHIRHVPVVKGGRLLGIVSDRDVRTATATGVASARGLMTPDPVTVTPDARIEHAARLMLGGRFGALPVMDGATLVGIVTYTDLLRAFVHVIETATEDRIAVDWAAIA